VPIQRLRQLALARGGVAAERGGSSEFEFSQATGSQQRGERVYANINRWRTATKPGNGEGEGGLQ
jgi:hypothetical protein